MQRSKMTKDVRIDFTTRFEKQRKAAPLEINRVFRETLALFLEDSYHPSLRNHPLKEKFAGYRSIDVTKDWRAIFKERKVGNTRIIVFHLLGTHAELYKNY